MKFKFIKCSQQGQPNLNVDQLELVSNVTYEIVETGTTIPDEYKTIERTIPTLSVAATLNIIETEAAVVANGKQWLTDTFGAANVVIE